MPKTESKHRKPLADTALTCWRVDTLMATPGRPMYLQSPVGLRNRHGRARVLQRPPLYMSDLMTQQTVSHMECFYSPYHQQPVADCHCGIHATRTHEALLEFGSTFDRAIWEANGNQIAVSRVLLHGPLFEQYSRDPDGTVVGSVAEYQQIFIPKRYLGNLPPVPQRVSVRPLETLSDQWARKLKEQK